MLRENFGYLRQSEIPSFVCFLVLPYSETASGFSFCHFNSAQSDIYIFVFSSEMSVHVFDSNHYVGFKCLIESNIAKT